MTTTTAGSRMMGFSGVHVLVDRLFCDTSPMTEANVMSSDIYMRETELKQCFFLFFNIKKIYTRAFIQINVI